MPPQFVWLRAVAMATAFAAAQAEEAPNKGLLLGPTISIRKNTDLPATIEAMKGLGANFLLTLGQVQDDAFLKACNEAGITIMRDGMGRIAVQERKSPEKYYQHSFTGAFFREWNDYLKGLAAAPGCHVLCCVPDELTWHNAQLRYTTGISPPEAIPFYATDDDSRARFKKETGMELPAFRRSRILDGKDPAERRYAILRYKWAEDSLRKWARTIRDTNKGVQVGAVLTSVPAFGLERYPSAMAWDLLGRESFVDIMTVTAFTTGYDYRGLDTHYYVSETAKTLAAAFGPKTQTGVVTVLYSTNLDDDPYTVRRLIDGTYLPTRVRPVDIYGTHIASAFHGAKVLSCYDGRYVDRDAKTFSQIKHDALKKGFEYLRRIEKPLVEGTEPREILVLVSRASEDYYMLDHADVSRNLADDGSAGIWAYGGWAQPANRCSWHGNRQQEHSKGFRSGQGLLHYLMKSGYVFVVRYLDQIDTFDLDGARTIILPFPYSVPTAVLPKLREAVSEGATLIIGNRLGELDENGVAYAPEPLLAALMPIEKGSMTPREGAEVQIKQGGGLATASVEVGKGAVHFVKELVMQAALYPHELRGADQLLRRTIQAGETVPVPSGPFSDIEAGYRQVGGGAYLGVINWRAVPQKATYVLPPALGLRKWEARNIDGSDGGITLDEKKGTVTFELGPHDVKGLVFR